MKLTEKIYFPNLNGLRAIAALCVVIHHIEMMKSMYNIDNQWENSPFIIIIGHLGVVLFFVLSGFLITYLLLTEEKITQNIDLKAFYVRRILRIWPLYFLIILSALFLLPNFSFFNFPDFNKSFFAENFSLKVFLYCTFFANFVLSYFGGLPYAAQTWSVATEEQFYLIWALLLKYLKINRIVLMLSVIAFYLGIKAILKLPLSVDTSAFLGFWNLFNIDCMAIGGLFAVLSFQNNPTLRLFQNTIFFYFILIISCLLIIFGYQFPFFHDKCYAFLFGIIILNFAQNKTLFFSLENRLLNYLGKISYGLYMFHFLAIMLIIQLHLRTQFCPIYLITPLSILLTIGISAISFRYFESFFLSYKEKFAKF